MKKGGNNREIRISFRVNDRKLSECKIRFKKNAKTRAQGFDRKNKLVYFFSAASAANKYLSRDK